jgi:hypothetical protein
LTGHGLFSISTHSEKWDNYPKADLPLEGSCYMAVGQNLVPLVNIKIAGKWMFIPLKMVLIGIDP